MAAVLLKNIKPRTNISGKSTPPVLKEVLIHIFQNSGPDLWLVGGTALAGYYAEHRRSDDLDLFAITPQAYRSAILTVKSLPSMGAIFSNERTSPYYYHVDSIWKNHKFTIDVVLDEHLGRAGTALKAGEALVADLPTIFAQKSACLVSRASEKDLFDLDWIFDQAKEIDIKEVIHAGQKFDGGVSTETLLISLQGAILRKEACQFLLPKAILTSEQAYKKIEVLRKKLISLLLEHEKKVPLRPELKALAKTMKRIKKNRLAVC